MSAEYRIRPGPVDTEETFSVEIHPTPDEVSHLTVQLRDILYQKGAVQIYFSGDDSEQVALQTAVQVTNELMVLVTRPTETRFFQPVNRESGTPTNETILEISLLRRG